MLSESSGACSALELSCNGVAYYSIFNFSTKNLEQGKGKPSGSGASSKGHKSSSSKDDAGTGELQKGGSAGSSPKSEGALARLLR